MIAITKSVRALYNTLANASPDSTPISQTERDACATVRDVIDMEMIPPEVLMDIALGKDTIADVMLGAADHLAEAQEDDLAHGLDDAEIHTDLIANMRSAAAVLRA